MNEGATRIGEGSPLEALFATVPVFDGDRSTRLQDDRSPWRRVYGLDLRHYFLRFASMGWWCALLSANYTLCRALFWWKNLPSDADSLRDAYDWYSSIDRLLRNGLVLSWFVGLTEVHRAKWVFHRQRWYFYVLFFVTGPVYSWLSDMSSLRHSLEDIDVWEYPMWISVASAAICTLGVMTWHIFYAMRENTQCGMTIYVMPRLVVIGYYVAFSLLLKNTHHGDIHLHHYFLAWVIALFAEFDHPISVCTLGVAASIFVQGIAVYGADELFNDSTCHDLSISQQTSCEISASAASTIRMCLEPRDSFTVECQKLDVEM